MECLFAFFVFCAFRHRECQYRGIESGKSSFVGRVLWRAGVLFFFFSSFLLFRAFLGFVAQRFLDAILRKFTLSSEKIHVVV